MRINKQINRNRYFIPGSFKWEIIPSLPRAFKALDESFITMKDRFLLVICNSISGISSIRHFPCPFGISFSIGSTCDVLSHPLAVAINIVLLQEKNSNSNCYANTDDDYVPLDTKRPK